MHPGLLILINFSESTVTIDSVGSSAQSAVTVRSGSDIEVTFQKNTVSPNNQADFLGKKLLFPHKLHVILLNHKHKDLGLNMKGLYCGMPGYPGIQNLLPPLSPCPKIALFIITIKKDFIFHLSHLQVLGEVLLQESPSFGHVTLSLLKIHVLQILPQIFRSPKMPMLDA